jgi:hypothetical protein
LADFDLISIMQTFWTFDYHGIAGGQTCHHRDVRSTVHAEANSAAFDLAIA